MITYNPKDWFTFIFRVHKAETLKRLWPLLLGVGIYSAAWAYLETVLFKDYKSVAMASNIGIIYSILGFTLSLFLVFRTNTASTAGGKDADCGVNSPMPFAISASTSMQHYPKPMRSAENITNRCSACSPPPSGFTSKIVKSPPISLPIAQFMHPSPWTSTPSKRRATNPKPSPSCLWPD